MNSSISLNTIIKVVFKIHQIITHRTYSPSLNFKNKWLSCYLIICLTVNLSSQTYIIIQFHKPMMVIWYLLIIILTISNLVSFALLSGWSLFKRLLLNVYLSIVRDLSIIFPNSIKIKCFYLNIPLSESKA